MISEGKAGRQLDVMGTVEIDAPGGRLLLEGVGDSVVVSAKSADAMRSLVGPLLRLDRTVRRHHFTRLGRGLEAAGLELSFFIDHCEIARLGGRPGSGVLARGLATPGLRVWWIRALRVFLLSRKAR